MSDIRDKLLQIQALSMAFEASGKTDTGSAIRAMELFNEVCREMGEKVEEESE